MPGLVEFPRTATRESLGTISFKSSNRFPLSSGARVDNPVMFPPGRARLATKPFPTGSASCIMTMGIVTVASLAARVSCRTTRDDDVYLETHELGRERREAIEFSLCISPLNDNVFPLDVPKLAQTLPECLDAGRDSGRGGTSLDILSGGFSSAAAPEPQPQPPRARKRLSKAPAILVCGAAFGLPMVRHCSPQVLDCRSKKNLHGFEVSFALIFLRNPKSGSSPYRVGNFA